MDKNHKICCVTGHRPKGFPWNYNYDPGEKYDSAFESTLSRNIRALELITNMMNWTDDSKYYVVPGQRFADEKAIVFNLDDAESFAIKTLKGGDENKSDDE